MMIIDGKTEGYRLSTIARRIRPQSQHQPRDAGLP